MAQARITLRPPPNVDFVQGYPGIPPLGNERPHAEVRGTIELRLGAQGVKAKWVRVELRKVETLPGGGQANTYYDFVGPSPVKVWEAQEEWGWLHTQDFPFSIRIPESIPPSIALEKNAGIKYELIATACLKGKKGFFHRATSPTLSTMTQIVIDKHELHSTWPIYAQPDTRHAVDGLLTLTVDRSHFCYGPGDRVTVTSTFRNDGVSAANLRAFEFLLKETVIFRAGPQVTGKKGAPQVKVTPIGEQKVPVNATVYGGQAHKADLGCVIPQSHTTTTVNSARHIDIAYSIIVKAVLSTGRPLLVEMPVTISNWPRSMSLEAVRRIGPAPNLSMIAPNHAPITPPLGHPQQPDIAVPTSPRINVASFPSPNIAATPRPAGGPHQLRPFSIAERIGSHVAMPEPASLASTLPIGHFGGGAVPARRGFDEFGYPTSPNIISSPNTTVKANGFSARMGASTLPVSFTETPVESRRRPPVNTNSVNRLTIVNGDAENSPDAEASVRRFESADEEKRRLKKIYEENITQNATPGPPPDHALPSPPPVDPPRPKPSASAWLTAEEEKKKLFERAIAERDKAQANLNQSTSTQPRQSEEVQRNSEGSTPSQVQQPVRQPSLSPWPTAEQEKLRLFHEAQEKARRTQALAAAGGSISINNALASDSPRSVPEFSHPTEVTLSSKSGAALYSSAMASVTRNPSVQVAPNQTPPKPAVIPSPPDPKQLLRQSPPATRTNFPTAEEEKAALRYYEAKRAVDRHQNMGSVDKFTSSGSSDGPIAYDALYPIRSGSLDIPSSSHSAIAGGSSANARPTSPTYGEFGSMTHRPSQSLTNGSFVGYESPPPMSPPLVPGSSGNDNSALSALAEKERLRKRYEAEEIAAAGPPLSPPPPVSPLQGAAPPNPPHYAPSPPRSQPLPPVSGIGFRPLTAAEEKARLRAQYEAEDAAAAASAIVGASNSAGGSSAISNIPSMSIPPYENGYASPPPLPPMSPSSSTLPESRLPPAINGLLTVNSSSPSASFSGLNVSESNSNSIPPPPPLAPRPPASYIHETQQEDARSQAEDHHVLSSIGATMDSQGPWSSEESRMDFGLSFRPFSPLDLAFDLSDRNSSRPSPAHTPGPPPPLPPKIPVE